MFNLAIFNHPYGTISDQVDWITALFQQNGIELTISDHFDPTRHNILIEGFSESACETIERHCRSTNQRVSIILTEHIELNQAPRINARSFNESSEEFPKASPGAPPECTKTETSEHSDDLVDQTERFYGLCRMIPLTYSFIILGESPNKSAIQSVFPSTPILCLPYPRIERDSLDSPDPQDTTIPSVDNYDLCFFGSQTPYRDHILAQLQSTLKEKLLTGTGFSTQHKCHILQNSRFNLHIPRDENDPVISPIQIISALENGTKTIHLSPHPISVLDKIIIPARTIEDVFSILAHHPPEPNEAIMAYNASYPKPLGSIFYNWAQTAQWIE